DAGGEVGAGRLLLAAEELLERDDGVLVEPVDLADLVDGRGVEAADRAGGADLQLRQLGRRTGDAAVEAVRAVPPRTAEVLGRREHAGRHDDGPQVGEQRAQRVV